MKTLKQFPDAETIDPTLRFTPTAWAKLLFFCHRGETEIGGFGVTDSDDLLLIREFVTVKQNVSISHVDFDDESVADFFEAQVDQGRKPEQFARIWCHTHPGGSASPSLQDEETFSRVFGGCQWAAMFILAREGESYCRLRFNVGLGGNLKIPVSVDYREEFGSSDHETWDQEYLLNVHADRTHAGLLPYYDDEFDVYVQEAGGAWQLVDCSLPEDEAESVAEGLRSEGLTAKVEESPCD